MNLQELLERHDQGLFWERFTPEAVRGWPQEAEHYRFKVVREEWANGERVVLEAELFDLTDVEDGVD